MITRDIAQAIVLFGNLKKLFFSARHSWNLEPALREGIMEKIWSSIEDLDRKYPDCKIGDWLKEYQSERRVPVPTNWTKNMADSFESLLPPNKD